MNGGSLDVPFNVRGIDEAEVRRKVTVDYIMKKVSDDWGMPIRNVTVLRGGPLPEQLREHPILFSARRNYLGLFAWEL